MKLEILGKPEGQKLELKAGDSLRRPEGIARSVVAMLNAEGGEIWIGVDVEGRRAGGVHLIPEVAQEEARLRSYLEESIDPRPEGKNVIVERVPDGAERGLLRVGVVPKLGSPDRPPHAFRKGGGWFFYRRVGASNRSMSREEVFRGPADGPEEPAPNRASRKLESERRAFLDEQGTGLWLGLQPGKELSLDLQAQELRKLALDPTLTGNRRPGWHFARSNRQPVLTKDTLEWGLWRERWGDFASRVQVQEGGGLRFLGSLARLHWKGEENELWPLALLEYPVSAFRIARVIYRGELAPEDEVAADLALLGVEGWGLRGGTPGDFVSDEELVRLEEPDLIWKPRVFRFEEIREAPDRCAFELVQRIYQAFGLFDSEMPLQFDRRSGRLVLPE